MHGSPLSTPPHFVNSEFILFSFLSFLSLLSLSPLITPRFGQVEAVAAFGHTAWLTAPESGDLLLAIMLSAFPFLTAEEFEDACRALADRACSSATDGGWSSIRLVTQVFLCGTPIAHQHQD